MHIHGLNNRNNFLVPSQRGCQPCCVETSKATTAPFSCYTSSILLQIPLLPYFWVFSIYCILLWLRSLHMTLTRLYVWYMCNLPTEDHEVPLLLFEIEHFVKFGFFFFSIKHMARNQSHCQQAHSGLFKQSVELIHHLQKVWNLNSPSFIEVIIIFFQSMWLLINFFWAALILFPQKAFLSQGCTSSFAHVTYTH